MAFIIAIEHDSQQAATLVRALNALPDLEVVVVESTDAALSVVDERVPDVILVQPFMDPGDEVHLAAYLRAHPHAAHVQVLTIPTLGTSRVQVLTSPPVRTSRYVTTASLLLGLPRERTASITPDVCDPRAFASDVVEYVSRAHVLKQTASERTVVESPRQSDRRRAYRWCPDDLPWVASVEMPGSGVATLVDFSSGGALVRTEQRPGPDWFRSGVPQAVARRSLTLRLTSGEAVRIAGKVIRCCVASRGDTIGLYEVAFRFDHSADAYTPVTSDSTASGDDWDASVTALIVRPKSTDPASVRSASAGISDHVQRFGIL